MFGWLFVGALYSKLPSLYGYCNASTDDDESSVALKLPGAMQLMQVPFPPAVIASLPPPDGTVTAALTVEKLALPLLADDAIGEVVTRQ